MMNDERVNGSDLDEIFTFRDSPDGNPEPVTVGEILNGTDPDAPPMGILGTTPPSNLNASPRRLTLGLAMALTALEPLARARPNRAERREERKRQRQARKRWRRG